MLPRIKASPRAQVVLILAMGVLYAVVGTASHHTQGHQEDAAAKIPHFLFPTAYGFNLPAETVNGRELSISVFPNTSDPDYDPSLPGRVLTALVNWNEQLLSEGPSVLDFQVFSWGGLSNSSADVRVVWQDGGCGSGACAGFLEPTDTSLATITINGEIWSNYNDCRKTQSIGHEMGHTLAHLNEHYLAGFDAYTDVAVMGRSTNCLASWPTNHDNTDFFDAYRQTAQLVDANEITRGLILGFDVEWENPFFSTSNERQHGESNFIIDRATRHSGPFSFYSLSSRNSIELDGRNRFGQENHPDDIVLAANDHWCFRLRTESFAFATTRSAHYGIQTSSDCVAMTQHPVVTTTHHIDGLVYVRVYNQSFNNSITGLQVTRYLGGVACNLTQTTVPPTESSACSFPSSNEKWTLLVWYNGAVQDIIDFDSYISN